MKINKSKGISLIVLIVTIIVVIILAAVVILTLSKNNPIESAKEASFKEDIRTFQDELALTVSKEYANAAGQRDKKITTSDFDEIKQYIPSFSEKYKEKFIIQDDELRYTKQLDDKEKEYAHKLNIKENQKLLPDEYQQVEYIESTGTQFINTEVYPKSTTKVIFDFSITDIVGYNGWGSAASEEAFFWGVMRNAENGYFFSNVSVNYKSIITNISVDYKRHKFILYSGGQLLDGIKYGETIIGDTATDKQYMYLFAQHCEWENRSGIYSQRS